MRNPGGRHSRAVAFACAEAKKSRSQAPREFAGSLRKPRLPLKSLSISQKTISDVQSSGTAGVLDRAFFGQALNRKMGTVVCR